MLEGELSIEGSCIAGVGSSNVMVFALNTFTYGMNIPVIGRVAVPGVTGVDLRGETIFLLHFYLI